MDAQSSLGHLRRRHGRMATIPLHAARGAAHTDNNSRSPVHPLPAHAGAGNGDRPLRHEPPADGGKGLGGNAGDDCKLMEYKNAAGRMGNVLPAAKFCVKPRFFLDTTHDTSYNKSGRDDLMSKWEKLLQRILSLSKDLRFDELHKVLEDYGYQMFPLATAVVTIPSASPAASQSPFHKHGPLRKYMSKWFAYC